MVSTLLQLLLTALKYDYYHAVQNSNYKIPSLFTTVYWFWLLLPRENVAVFWRCCITTTLLPHLPGHDIMCAGRQWAGRGQCHWSLGPHWPGQPQPLLQIRAQILHVVWTCQQISLYFKLKTRISSPVARPTWKYHSVMMSSSHYDCECAVKIIFDKIPHLHCQLIVLVSFVVPCCLRKCLPCIGPLCNAC